MIFHDEIGTVLSHDGTTTRIQFRQGTSCEDCCLRILCSPGPEHDGVLSLENTGGWTPGQRVRLQEMSSLEFHLAFAQFGMPMVLFLLGILAGYVLGPSLSPRRELIAFLGGLIGLAGSYPLAKSLVNHISRNITRKYLRVMPVD